MPDNFWSDRKSDADSAIKKTNSW